MEPSFGIKWTEICEIIPTRGNMLHNFDFHKIADSRDCSLTFSPPRCEQCRLHQSVHAAAQELISNQEGSKSSLSPVCESLVTHYETVVALMELRGYLIALLRETRPVHCVGVAMDGGLNQTCSRQAQGSKQLLERRTECEPNPDHSMADTHATETEGIKRGSQSVEARRQSGGRICCAEFCFCPLNYYLKFLKQVRNGAPSHRPVLPVTLLPVAAFAITTLFILHTGRNVRQKSPRFSDPVINPD